MPLTFPTMAEKALADWKAQTRTISLTIICERHGGQRETHWGSNGKEIFYVFDDDTVLSIRGTGANHKVETLLP